MDAISEVLVVAGAAVAAWMAGWFVLATLLRNNSIVDIAWGLGFVLISWVLVAWTSAADGAGAQLLAVAVLVSIWGVRLSWHIGRRNIGHAEDFRYAQWREDWGRWVVPRAFVQVFMLQGVLMLLVALPILVAAAAAPASLGVLGMVGVVVFAIGFGIESVADRQLARFIREEKTPEQPVMQSGLWRYSRHPNYFGEAVLWWGIALLAVSAPNGWLALLGAAAITFLLRWVSGVPFLEQRFEGRPGWDDYVERTSIFIMLPPRRSAAEQ